MSGRRYESRPPGLAKEICDEIRKLEYFAGFDAEKVNHYGEGFGKELADRRNGLKTAQLRRIFSEMTKLRLRVEGEKVDREKTDIRQKVLLLKPKLAYTAGRAGRPTARGLYEIMSCGIDKIRADYVKGKKDFLRLFDFFEAMLAYHKYHGGQ